MRFTTFSNKQLIILTWWTENSPYKDYDGIIADGSIRAGKTLSMTLSFVFWAMKNYSGQQFGMSGKAVGAFNRNITFWLIGALKLRGYKVQYNASDHYIYVKIKNKETNQIHENWFYIFGGTDERSYQFIQGMTAAGWFFDEAALQPESFVNQAIGRCSVDGAKIWFNCNPDKPLHWFKKDFIDNASEKNLIHVHFLMEDNPSLSKKVIDRYKSMYSGVFYLRYILGQWALAEGIIYDMITDANYYTEPLGKKKWQGTRYISIDYGTINPVSVHNYYDCWDVAYCDDEYYLPITTIDNIEYTKDFINKKYSSYYCCNMVAYSYKGMKQMIELFELYGLKVTDLYYENMINNPNLNIYRLTTHFINRPFHSNISDTF